MIDRSSTGVRTRQKFVTLLGSAANMSYVSLRQCTEMVSILFSFILQFPYSYSKHYVPYKYIAFSLLYDRRFGKLFLFRRPLHRHLQLLRRASSSPSSST